MAPTPTQFGNTYPPLCGTLQAVATGFIPWGTVEDLPAEVVMDVPVRPNTAHVAHGGDAPGVGMNNSGPDSKGDHWHKRGQHVRYPLEGGGDAG